MRTSSFQTVSLIVAMLALGALFHVALADGWNNGHKFSDSFEADLDGIETISIAITKAELPVLSTSVPVHPEAAKSGNTQTSTAILLDQLISATPVSRTTTRIEPYLARRSNPQL